MKVSSATEHLIYRLSVFCSIEALVARQKWSLSCRDARAESRERLGIRVKLSNQQNGEDESSMNKANSRKHKSYQVFTPHTASRYDKHAVF